MIRRVFLAVALASLGVAASCSDASGPYDISGTYILRTADGRPVPIIMYADEVSMDELLSGEVRLNADQSFVDITALRLQSNGEDRIEELVATGTFARENSTVTFNVAGGGQYQMTVEPNRLTQDWNGYILVYTRQ